MLRWALAFLIVALIAGAFGYSGVESTAVSIAQTLFFLFLALCVITFIAGYFFLRNRL